MVHRLANGGGAVLQQHWRGGGEHCQQGPDGARADECTGCGACGWGWGCGGVGGAGFVVEKTEPVDLEQRREVDFVMPVAV